MQRITHSGRGRRLRDATVRRSERPAVAATLGVASSTGIETLARSSGQSLPTLESIPTEYSHEVHAELLYDLCAALVRSGLAEPSLWNDSGASGIMFARTAILAAIGNQSRELLERNVEYHLQISDVIERFGDDRALETSELAVTISNGNCGYVELGAAIEVLEHEEKGLGAAFYWLLTHSLYRVMRLYNHEDAFLHEERLREYAEEDESNSEQYEFPEVEKGLPECIRATLKRDHASHRLRDRRLLLRHRKGQFGSWIERLRRIQRLSRLYPKRGQDLNESGDYDGPPLPSLLVAFKQHDVITACFDEESQYMLEGMPEPNVSVVFSPHDLEEVGRTAQIIRRFIAINCELFHLVEELQKWEADHGCGNIDRGELSLRAA